MICKVSFFKSIRETLKHHVASVFATCLVFFVQLIVFALQVQNLTQESPLYASDTKYLFRQLQNMTQPGYGYMIPVILVAILLAFDFFRYLHSKKQIDFYESLPVRRKTWYAIRTFTAFLIFLLPFTLCIGMEMLLFGVFDVATSALLLQLLWNYVCMILTFLATWFTAVLAMVITGHSVIASFGFFVLCAYAPIFIRFLYPAYAYSFFKTYVSGEIPLHFLTYFSPIGAAAKLIQDSSGAWSEASHGKDFLILLIFIFLLGGVTYYLFVNRPSEAAGRAMTFEKANPIIRILLVIPLTLYLGIGLYDMTSVGKNIWLVFGFIIGAILLHGIIESIFQFDIRGFLAHKKQVICCMIACVGITCLFWFDLLGYDSYLPDSNEVESISIQVYNDYYYGNTEDGDGISGEYLEDALLLAKNILNQNVKETDEDSEWIQFEYRLKNGAVRKRSYSMNFEQNKELLDKIYATKELKDDYCRLYHSDWSHITSVRWVDSATDFSLNLSDTEMEHLLETYLAEYTPFTYSQERTEIPLGYLVIYQEEEMPDNKAIYSSVNPFETYCYIYPEFTQTISILDGFLARDTRTQDYGSISESILDKYEIVSLEFYREDYKIFISDPDRINTVKEQLIVSEYFYKSYKKYNPEEYYDGTIGLTTGDGIRYVSVMIPKDVSDTFQ